MRTIYLHIGRGKTGTTTIQKFLMQQRDALLTQGIHVIHADDDGRGVGHQRFAKSFITDVPWYMDMPANPERFRGLIADEIRETNANAIVISSENLTLAEPGLVIDYFQQFADAFTLKVILFVRSQEELAESEYNQLVKFKAETRPFQQYLDETLADSDFMAEATGWEELVGRENLICAIPDMRAQNAVSEFLRCINAQPIPPSDDAPGTSESIAPNASIGTLALIAGRALNGTELRNRPDLKQIVFNALRTEDVPALLFDVDEARAYRQRYAESNRAFTQRYLGQEYPELPGRRYIDEERAQIREKIRTQGLDSLL